MQAATYTWWNSVQEVYGAACEEKPETDACWEALRKITK